MLNGAQRNTSKKENGSASNFWERLDCLADKYDTPFVRGVAVGVNLCLLVVRLFQIFG